MILCSKMLIIPQESELFQVAFQTTVMHTVVTRKGSFLLFVFAPAESKLGPFLVYFFARVVFVCIFCAALVAKQYFCGQGLFLALAFQFYKDDAKYFVKDDQPRKFQRKITNLCLEAHS